ncbi:AAA family ATPase [Sulfitobacter sp. F26204]|uniref:AAA family ATPase n=1 Tax=Sulfitobacter sp. F26204 TaxID=2996014 RepID=UPI003A4C6DC8
MLRTEDRALDDRGFRVLLAGVKGSGLPAAIAAIWREFDLPLVRYDAARLRGRKILNDAEMFLRLVEQCENNLKRASRGAIVIENIDRLFERNQADRIVQEELELLLAGTTESVSPQGGRKHPQQEFLQLDTSGITFIATTSKLHANDPPIVSGDELPSLRFGKDRAKLSAALVGQGALPTLMDRFDEILEYLPYTTAQIETWLASPDAAPHLDAFKHEEGILPDDLRRALIDAACDRGAGFDGLISILRLVKLRRSFTGPDGSVPEPIDPAWLAKSI